VLQHSVFTASTGQRNCVPVKRTYFINCDAVRFEVFHGCGYEEGRHLHECEAVPSLELKFYVTRGKPRAFQASVRDEIEYLPLRSVCLTPVPTC
jgi:hypothetical protein